MCNFHYNLRCQRHLSCHRQFYSAAVRCRTSRTILSRFAQRLLVAVVERLLLVVTGWFSTTRCCSHCRCLKSNHQNSCCIVHVCCCEPVSLPKGAVSVIKTIISIDSNCWVFRVCTNEFIYKLLFFYNPTAWTAASSGKALSKQSN